jgi:adenine-specific DNA methylase
MGLFDPDRLPACYDPFAWGGALRLEAHRLELEAYASALNPVAVLINQAMNLRPYDLRRLKAEDVSQLKELRL